MVVLLQMVLGHLARRAAMRDDRRQAGLTGTEDEDSCAPSFGQRSALPSRVAKFLGSRFDYNDVDNVRTLHKRNASTLSAAFALARGEIALLAGFAGASLGSFATAALVRSRRGASVWTSRSACDRCGSRVRWFDAVPIAGWIALRGRCRDCGAAIPAGYLFVEAACALVAAAVALFVTRVA